MNEQFLKTLGLTAEQTQSIKRALSENYVTKSDVGSVNAELEAAKQAISERDTQLAQLSKATGDATALKQQISDLQTQNAKSAESYAASLSQLRVDHAVNSALLKAHARNPETVKPLLAAFLAGAETDEFGVKGLDDAVKQLAESADTKYLFADPITLAGFKPGESADNPPDNSDPFLSGFEVEI